MPRYRLFGLAAWLLATVFVAAPTTLAAERHALLGAPAPEFAARATNGRNFRLSEHRGDVVVVSFWSGRCNTCRSQLAALERISQTYASVGLVVVSLNLDDNVKRAQEFANAQNVSFALSVEPAKEVGRQYFVDTLPMTFFVDRAGNVRRVRREWTPRDENSYVRELRVLLNE
jgi:peroxiredoxin